jgi:predicted PurR-regulated permease PerM
VDARAGRSTRPLSYEAVARYVLGNITIRVLTTIATRILLSILGVPYALAPSFVVGSFDLIPLVGATLGAIVVGSRL